MQSHCKPWTNWGIAASESSCHSINSKRKICPSSQLYCKNRNHISQVQTYLPVQPQKTIGSAFTDSIYSHRFPLFVERKQSKELLTCFTVTMSSATRILCRELEIPILKTMSNPLLSVGTVNLMSSRKSWVILPRRKTIQKITCDKKGSVL